MKVGFNLYALNSLRFKKMMIKQGYKQYKNADLSQIAGDVFSSDFSNNLDKHLLISEVLWDHDGRNVIFPGDVDLYKNLLKSKFSLDGCVSLKLPYESFILAMPKGFEIDGIAIPSVIVQYCRAGYRRARYDLAASKMSLSQFVHDEGELAGKDSLSFFYQSPNDDLGVMVQVNQSLEQVSLALKASSPAEYALSLGRIPDHLVSPCALEPSDIDVVLQYTITKLVAGISVYLSANGIDSLQLGLPAMGSISMNNMKTDLRYSLSHIPSFTAGRSSLPAENLSYRRFHFRQLRSPIYYQNEHKDLPCGSRWVFVKEAIVGDYNAKTIM